MDIQNGELSLYLVSFLILQIMQFVYGGPNGFTIELVHRDSIDSPLYPGNLTIEERFTRLHHQASARLKQVAGVMTAAKKQTMSMNYNTTTSLHPEEIQSPVSFDGTFYLTMEGIGSFAGTPSFKSHWLMADTGSSLLWTQCEGCKPFYNQTVPFYPFSKSTTYRPVLCDKHPSCSPPGHCTKVPGVGNVCNYGVAYAGQAVTKGRLAWDKFTFLSANHQSHETVDLLFGCGLEQTNFHFNTPAGGVTSISGIFGLGYGPESLLAQLGARTQGRLSHCLKPWTPSTGHIPPTFLKFGVDAKFEARQQVHTTPLYIHPAAPMYFVTLKDISVFGTKLSTTFPVEDFFKVKPDGSSGTMIDNGCPWTYVKKPAYDHMLAPLLAFFKTFKAALVPSPYQHCYANRPGFKDFPSITLHFLNADYFIGPDKLFVSFNNQFCINMVPLEAAAGPGPSVITTSPSMMIGNSWQTNFRFIFDIRAKQVSFATEIC